MRKNFFEIYGVLESVYSMIEEVVLKLVEVFEVLIIFEDVEIFYKLKWKGNKLIIVKFVNYKIKSNIYKLRIKLKNIKVFNLFFGVNVVICVVGDCIFLYENFIFYRKKIVNCVNEMRRDVVLLSVWILDGKVYVKILLEGRLIKINDLEDLESL